LQTKIFTKLDNFIYYLSSDYDPNLLKTIEKKIIIREGNKFQEGYFKKIENQIKKEFIHFNEKGVVNDNNFPIDDEDEFYDAEGGLEKLSQGE
jgi:hypothetical protein